MELRDKIAGALYGMALGDAMGMPAELWGRERARKFFGGKITDYSARFFGLCEDCLKETVNESDTSENTSGEN